MNHRYTQIGNRLVSFIIPIMVLLLVYGCGTVEHTASVNKTFAPPANTLVLVAPVTNQFGYTSGGAERRLTDALVNALRSEKLLWSHGQGEKLVLECSIEEYKKGNAFIRWVFPGSSSTVLSVRGDLRSGKRIVGSVYARRAIHWGGLFTIGAWATIFGDVAGDIARDLREKVPA